MYLVSVQSSQFKKYPLQRLNKQDDASRQMATVGKKYPLQGIPSGR
jgi:hypothetical protein